mgnify:CR=1 FL=1
MTASQWMEISISSWSEIFLRHLSKYFIYLTSNDRENVKSRFSFLLSSITWIIIESLKLALSMLESRFEVYYAAAADAPPARGARERPRPPEADGKENNHTARQIVSTIIMVF